MEEIYDHYGCEDMYTDGVKNCTAIDLASLQWGSLGVTNNTKESWGSFYTPNATTVAGWGDQPTWLPYGVLSVEPEYPQNTAAQEENYSYIEWSTAQVLISPDYFEYGLNGFYNWQAFLVPFFTSD